MNDLDNLDIGKGGTMGGDALVGLFDKPNKMFENALSSLTKKTASTAWGKFKKQLATASEPIFRKDMGERYLSSANLYGGCLIWGIATLIALCIPPFRSGLGLLFEIIGWHDWAQLLQLWPFPLATGAALIFFNWIFGRESIGRMKKYRDEGAAYHSMSRGIARWGENQRPLAKGITIIICMFDLPAGILFFASICMSGKLALEQQEAIYARYLDALDAKIEQEYLENAILGKCPTQITQLTYPLPPDLNSDLRNNIAAAAVGKPIKMMAQAPKGKQPGAPTQPTTTPSGTSKKPNSPYASSGVAPTSETELKAQISQSIESTKAESLKVLQSPSVRQDATGHMKLWKIVVGVCLMIGLAWGGMVGIQKMKARKSQETSTQPQATSIPATTNVPAPIAPAIAEATQEKTVPQLQTNSATDATTTQPTMEAVQAERERIAQKEEKARLESEKAREAEQAAALETKQKQEIIEREKVKSQMADLITAQLIQIPKFQTNCSQSLAAALKATGVFSTKSRVAIKQLQDTVNKSAESQESALQTWQTQLPLFSQTPSSSWQGQLNKVKKNTEAMAAQRDQLTAQVKAINTSAAK